MIRFPGDAKLGFLFAFVLLLALTAGCGTDVASSESDVTAPAAASPSAEALAALEMADAADDKADKVVNKCTMCKLGMEGKAEHAASYGGYTLQFCSDHCKTSFEKDPEAALLSLK